MTGDDLIPALEASLALALARQKRSTPARQAYEVLELISATREPLKDALRKVTELERSGSDLAGYSDLCELRKLVNGLEQWGIRFGRDALSLVPREEQP